jgi:hypothetical protein
MGTAIVGIRTSAAVPNQKYLVPIFARSTFSLMAISGID